MPIDSSIYSQIRQPEAINPLAMYGQAMQLQNAIQSNQVNALKMQEYERARVDDAAQRTAVQGFGADSTANYNRLLQTGNLKSAQDYQKGITDTANKKAETDKTLSEVQKARILQHRDLLANVNDPQTAAKWVQYGYTDEVTGPIMQKLLPMEEAVSKIPSDPAGFQRWKQEAALGATKFVEMNKPTFTTRNLGGTTDTLATDSLTGATRTLNSAANTQSPDNAASNARMAAEGAANRGITIRGQNLIDQRSRDANEGVDSPFTPEAISNAASRYNIDGTLPPMGMGKAGSTGRAAILNKAAELAAGSGKTGDQQRIDQIGNKANSAALSKIQQSQTMVGAFEKNFNKNAGIALEYSGKVDRTGVPIANKWINAGKRSVTGDPDLSAYDQSIKSVVNEYSKIISGSMGNTATAEGEIKKVESLLNAAQTPAQVSAVISLMKRETQNRMAGFEEEKKALRITMSGQPTAAPVQAASPLTSPFDPTAIAAELKRRGH